MKKKIAIRYFSRGGNTKKLALALEEELNVKALDVSHKLTEDVDILFLGSSVYAAGVDDEIKKFIDNIDVNIGTVINFSTAALISSTYKQVKKLLDNKKITLSKDEFHCRGSFGIMHKGRPNNNDLKNIKEFAKKVTK